MRQRKGRPGGFLGAAHEPKSKACDSWYPYSGIELSGRGRRRGWRRGLGLPFAHSLSESNLVDSSFSSLPEALEKQVPVAGAPAYY